MAEDETPAEADELLENMSENQVPEGAGRESNNGL